MRTERRSRSPCSSTVSRSVRVRTTLAWCQVRYVGSAHLNAQSISDVLLVFRALLLYYLKRVRERLSLLLQTLSCLLLCSTEVDLKHIIRRTSRSLHRSLNKARLECFCERCRGIVDKPSELQGQTNPTSFFCMSRGTHAGSTYNLSVPRCKIVGEF